MRWLHAVQGGPPGVAWLGLLALDAKVGTVRGEAGKCFRLGGDAVQPLKEIDPAGNQTREIAQDGGSILPGQLDQTDAFLSLAAAQNALTSGPGVSQPIG